MYCGCKMNCAAASLRFPSAISLPYQSKPLITTASSVCMQPRNTLWLINHTAQYFEFAWLGTVPTSHLYSDTVLSGSHVLMKTPVGRKKMTVNTNW